MRGKGEGTNGEDDPERTRTRDSAGRAVWVWPRRGASPEASESTGERPLRTREQPEAVPGGSAAGSRGGLQAPREGGQERGSLCGHDDNDHDHHDDDHDNTAAHDDHGDDNDRDDNDDAPAAAPADDHDTAERLNDNLDGDDPDDGDDSPAVPGSDAHAVTAHIYPSQAEAAEALAAREAEAAAEGLSTGSEDG